MIQTQHLIDVADAYMVAAGIERDQTVSYRVFGDTKKLTAMRNGAQITVDRFNSAMDWFRNNWPDGHSAPSVLGRERAS